MTIHAGSRLGPAPIVSKLGAAAWAECTRPLRRVSDAARPAHTSMAADPEAWLRACGAVASLGHPDLCTLFDPGSDLGSKGGCQSCRRTGVLLAVRAFGHRT